MLVGLGLIALSVLWPRGPEAPERAETSPRGMFEWDEAAVEDPAAAIQLAERLEIGRWYQEFGGYDGAEAFVAALREAGIEVYALLGATEWGFEADGASFIAALREIVTYNRAHPDQPIAGVMADIEPYTQARFKEDPEGSMALYVSGMEKAYGYAKANELTLITCIARHYDDQGLTEGLERLIAASDEVAVMNYDCGGEVAAIRTEAELSLKHGKRLHCILEFQEVGKHGLTEAKTYRNKGLDAAKAAFEAVDAAYPKLDIVWDYHWSQPIREMLEE
ncbi:hypothetical protein [Gehongia tenuis]|uniref:Uncharacterized protein n=1 Tax=Gehongia tenuis TaxID=2763655 RepID=A0A926HPY0_9FIRM|nr:hypothetical protein [Gehongia tenuis]MBC8530676.1 hypothetical protein [Gehongia tenuis]